MKLRDVLGLLPTPQRETPPAEAKPVRPVVVSSQPLPFHDDARDSDQSQEANTWQCPHCGQPATIDDVFPSQDGERTLTMWSCEPCGVVAVTPSNIKQPPTGWVKRAEQ